MVELNTPEGTTRPEQKGSPNGIAIEINGKSDLTNKNADRPKEAEINFEINNYVYKKIYEEWLETRIVEKNGNLVTIYILKTHSLMNCHLMDLFPSTIETVRKFKISAIKPQTFYNNPHFIRIATDNTIFDMKYDLLTLLEHFKVFLLKNKSTVYLDELEQFLVYVEEIFRFYQQTIFTLDEQRRMFFSKERVTIGVDRNRNSKENNITEKGENNKEHSHHIECHPVHILRLCILWHFSLKNNISQDDVIKTGYDFLIYLTDWVVLTFFN